MRWDSQPLATTRGNVGCLVPLQSSIFRRGSSDMQRVSAVGALEKAVELAVVVEGVAAQVGAGKAFAPTIQAQVRAQEG